MINEESTESKSILIVDDEPSVCRILGEYTKLIGYNPIIAYSCNDVVLALDKQIPDIVFLDILLPDVDGIIILRLLKKLEPNLPVVMISGIEMDETARFALENGAFDYVTKPFEYQRISDILKAIEFSTQVI